MGRNHLLHRGRHRRLFRPLDHTVMMNTLREKIYDGRFLRLIEHFLVAGYLEDWRYHKTLSGCPQGSILSRAAQRVPQPIRYVCRNNAYATVQQRRTSQTQHGIYTGTRRGTTSQASRAMEGGKSPTQAPTAASLLRHHRPRLPPLRYLRYADDVRHLTQDEILLAEKRGSEEDDLWGYTLPT